jgi:hypothetical protein
MKINTNVCLTKITRAKSSDPCLKKNSHHYVKIIQPALFRELTEAIKNVRQCTSTGRTEGVIWNKNCYYLEARAWLRVEKYFQEVWGMSRKNAKRLD